MNRPVNYVSWGDAARFCNWLHNGQPTGAQDDTTTEEGAYDLDGATSDAALMEVRRSAGASWFIPTESEWYKAAYYRGAGLYWEYPTRTNNAPTNVVYEPDRGNQANFLDYPPTWMGNGTYTLGSPYYTTEVGEFERSDGPYGTF